MLFFRGVLNGCAISALIWAVLIYGTYAWLVS